MSEAWPPWPRARSGAMYWSVPTMSPELVGVIGLGGDDLQRDEPVERGVVRLVDAAHAAAADALDDPVLPDFLDHGRYRSKSTLMLSRPPRALALSTSASHVFSRCSSLRATVARMDGSSSMFGSRSEHSRTASPTRMS